MKKQAGVGTGVGVVLMDSITELTPDDAGTIVVSASHGGVSAGRFALGVPLVAVFFNDAGVGKDGAGIAALAMLQKKGVAAGAVSHTSARIGDCVDTWSNGVVSHVNGAARALGFEPGSRLQPIVLRIIARRS